MNSSVIPFGSRVLTPENLHRNAPSIFAETARPGVSSRYTFVSTAQVIDLLRELGWEPVRAGQQSVRLAARQGFQLHEIRFARRSDLAGLGDVGATRPEMILQNAHDGSRAYRIDAGIYRLVCRNGLVVADATFAHVAIRHVDVSVERFQAAAQAVAAGVPAVMDVIARWQAVALTPAARLEFARRALALRWTPDDSIGRLLAPESLLSPVRYADHVPDLWTTYNVVQEHVVRGGDRYAGMIPNSDGSRAVVRNRTRPVGGLHEGQRLNKDLWSLAEEFSRN